MTRKTRISMIEESREAIKRTQQNFMRMIQGRPPKMKMPLAPFLPNELVFRIFLLLPIKTLMKFTCVCKSWKKMIHCAQFVEAYNHKAQTSVILLRDFQLGRLLDTSFNIETEVSQLEYFSIFPFDSWESQRGKAINFLEIKDRKGKFVDLNISCLGSIVAICNGLILFSSTFNSPRMTNNNVSEVPTLDRGRLIIMNPMTRKFLGLPFGTPPSDLVDSETYGLMFSHLEGVYKVVHLFEDELGLAFEVWSPETRYWRVIDGPPETISVLGQMPIWASGALHWLAIRDPHHPIDSLLSIRANDERFIVIKLPMLLGPDDKLLEMGGVLSLVKDLDKDKIEVWMLKGLEGSECIKQYTIQIDAVVGDAYYKEYVMPVFAMNAKEMVFQSRTKLFSYDFEAEEMKEIEVEGRSFASYETLMPLTNNLVTWERLEPML